MSLWFIRAGANGEYETLFQTLLHRAFDGSLTANWRVGHAKEVMQEMENKKRSKS